MKGGADVGAGDHFGLHGHESMYKNYGCILGLTFFFIVTSHVGIFGTDNRDYCIKVAKQSLSNSLCKI